MVWRSKCHSRGGGEHSGDWRAIHYQHVVAGSPADAIAALHSPVANFVIGKVNRAAICWIAVDCVPAAAIAHLPADGREHFGPLPGRPCPLVAAGDQIVAIPTLVRKLPQPLRKIVGDLRDVDRALVGLQLRPGKSPQ